MNCEGVGNTILSGFLSLAGNLLTDFYPGGLLSMVAETMRPEAFSESPDFTGFVTVPGFLLFFT